MDRRSFLIGLGGAGVMARTKAAEHAAGRGSGSARRQVPGLSSDRQYWIGIMQRLADPVLTNLANGTLKTRMPVETVAGAESRRRFAHLEAFGRLLAGLAPWLEVAPDESAEGRLRARYGDLARRALASAADPASPDFLNFTEPRQPLVDAAFLAQAILRAPTALWGDLDARVRAHVVQALESTREILPGPNNWLMFAATVEAALLQMGARWDRTRVDYAVRQHEQWYLGDGVYGDGPQFHWDYYNSFVIQPMLIDVLRACAAHEPAWERLQEAVRTRAQRYAAVLERMISPEGTFPPLGRSLAYRFGALQGLAQSALHHTLPVGVSPAAVRAAMTAVIRRQIEAPGTFDDQGWLRIGFCGRQPGIAEPYISTGSVYLCAVGLLPLGLPADDEFWTDPPRSWTARRAWAGEAFPIDKALV